MKTYLEEIKLFFLNVNDRNLNCNSFLKFGYPNNFSNIGYFWTDKYEEQNFINQINKIYNELPAVWLSKTSKIIKKIIIYDFGNKNLQNRLVKNL